MFDDGEHRDRVESFIRRVVGENTADHAHPFARTVRGRVGIQADTAADALTQRVEQRAFGASDIQDPRVRRDPGGGDRDPPALKHAIERLHRRYDAADMRRALVIGVIAIAAAAAVIVLGAIGEPAATYQHGDFLQFWIEPHAFFEGASPYDPVWWAAVHERIGVTPLFAEAVYPPYDALVFLPLAAFPLSYAAAAWLVGQILAVAAVAFALARRIADPAARVVFLAIVVSFQPVWLLVVGGNVTGFLFAALGGAYLAALDRRPMRCGAFLGLLAVKPHPFVFVALAAIVLADRSSRRSLLEGALTTAGPLIAFTLLLRPSWYTEWLPAALGLQAAPGSNATVWTIGRLVGLEAPLLGGVAAIAVIAAFGVWARRTRPQLAAAIATAVPVSLMIAPHGWSYDQLQLLVPLAVLIDRTGDARSSISRAVRATLALGASAVPWLLYVIAFRRGGEELSVLSPLVVFALLLLVRAHPHRADDGPVRAARPAHILA